MSPLPVDLDSESVQLENGWYTKEELARKIRAMLDTGDFAIGRPSQALEELTQVLQSLQTLAFRVTPEMADAITAEASRQGKTVASLVRDAVSLMLSLPVAQVIDHRGVGANPEVPIVPESIEPEALFSRPEPLVRKASDAYVPSVVVDPGGISPSREALPVEAVAKRKEEEIEQRWFGT